MYLLSSAKRFWLHFSLLRQAKFVQGRKMSAMCRCTNKTSQWREVLWKFEQQISVAAYNKTYFKELWRIISQLFGKIFLKQHLFITLTASIEFPIMSVIKSSDLACSEFWKVYCLQPQTTNACYFQILHMRDIFLWFSIILYWNDPQMTPIFSNTYVFQK